jgi:uncharacterized protein YbjT (DUF2867 family)
MRLFVAGATGVIGKRLVPLLVQAGHSVTGMTRTQEKAGSLRSAGANAAIVDALDPTALPFHRLLTRANSPVSAESYAHAPA